MKRKLLLPLAFLFFATTSSLHVFGQLSGQYQQDFEGSFPPAGWQTVDVSDPYNSWEQSPIESYSGGNSAHINYASGDGEDWLILPQFTVAASDSFSFWLSADFLGYPPDSTWILVSTTDSNLSSFTTTLAAIHDGIGGGYPATKDSFQYYAYSLSAFAGQNIYIAIENRNNNGDGLYFDLITIGTPPSLDARAVSIDVPDVVSSTTSILPKATVKNSSLTDQSFFVTMNISDGYSSTKVVTNLASGASQQIDFDLWAPVAGPVTVSIQTLLAGDEVPDNDTISKVVSAMPPISGYYQEDFEGTFPPFGWQTLDVLDPSDVWEQNTDLPYSGISNTYLQYSPMNVQGEDWLILPQWTTAASDSFSFWMAVQSIPYPPDSTEILVSTTDAYPSSFTNVIGILSQGVNYPTPTNTYKYYSFSLAAYDGQNIYVALRNRNVYGDGIYVDLTSIGTPPPVLSAATVSINVKDYISTSTFSPTATVINKSDAVQSFPVTMTITGGYSSTKNVTNLAAAAVQQITFDPWTPALGNDTITVETQLPADTIPSDNILTKLVKAFDPFLNYGWTAKTAATETVRDEALAAVNHPNGTSELYVLAGVSGGFLSADNLQYDPTADTWSSLTPMTTANYTSSATAINDKIYVIGGLGGPFNGGIEDNQIYDIATNSWSNGAPMPTPVGDYAFGVYHDSLLYYIGGVDLDFYIDYNLVQIYNPATDTWTSGTALPVTGYGWQGGIVKNKIVVSGGANLNDGLLPSTYVGTIDVANPANIIWAQVDDFPTGNAFRSGAGTSIDSSSNLVVFTGGSPTGSGSDASNSTFAYDVNSNAWKIGPDKPTAVNNLRNLACMVYNDSVYMVSVGGFLSNEFDVNEWLNLGLSPFATGITHSNPVNSDVSSYPNPFTKLTSISFSLDHSSTVKISIVDVMGKEVATLCDKTLPAGTQQITWNASGYSAGVYFCKVNVNGNITTQKLVKLN